jgi:carboxypeptidase PM20D1
MPSGIAPEGSLKKWVRAVIATAAVPAAVLAFNAARIGSRQIDIARNDEAAPAAAVAAQRLAQAVRFQTLSHQHPSKFPGAEFDRFHAFLAVTYPRVQSAPKKRQVYEYSPVYEWSGTDASFKPVLMMAHQDVVPIDPASADKWPQSPFGGIISDALIRGRGTLDDKGTVMALHEVAETLLTPGFRPKRTVYFAFGHDEEVDGREGSPKIGQWLSS